MIDLRIITSILSTFIMCANLNAQYDGGTVIHNQISSTNPTSILRNYIVKDFDGDSNPDIIMVKHNSSNNTYNLTWHKGNGSGNFTP